MLKRLIAMLLLFSFGFSAMEECCMVCDEGHHDESTESVEHRSYDSDKSYASHDTDEHQQSNSQDCDDHCSACLHTALTQSADPSFAFAEARFSYPERAATSLLSRTASIDRPPCWTA